MAASVTVYTIMHCTVMMIQVEKVKAANQHIKLI